MGNRLRLQGLTIRAALVLGFSLVLGLWLTTGLSFARRLADAQAEAASLNERYLRAQDVLSVVRAQVFDAAAKVRDALLDPGATPEYRRQLDGSINAIEQAVSEYVLIFGTAEEREQLSQLRANVDSFSQGMIELLGRSESSTVLIVRDRLNRVVAPARDRVVENVNRIQALNRQQFVQWQQTTSQTYGGIHLLGWERLGIVLAISVGIAMLAILYSGRLERTLRHQQTKEARTATDLQHLSAKLINVQEDERRAIARELHDEIGQALMAIKVELAYTQRAITTMGGPGQLLQEAQLITDGVIRSVRDLSQLLHPPLLDDMGLPAAVDWYISGFGRRHPIQVELDTDQMDERLSPEIETAAYRILQEALTNVAKHSGASTCTVRLRREPTALMLTVQDDGHGFDANALERSGTRRGLGLIGIRERVAQLHGSYALDSSPHAGTTLTVSLPVDASAGVVYEEPSPVVAALTRTQVSHE